MRVNEIFHSLQGEGYHTGTPAVFVRMSGCNLACPFCDTRHQAYVEMTEDEITAAVARMKAPMVVFTGGEPALQLTSSLVQRMQEFGYLVCVETNGTVRLPEEVDWVTLSPKDMFLGSKARPVLQQANELKVVYDGVHEPEEYADIAVEHRFLQPCDTGDPVRNDAIVHEAVEYCLRHPRWRLSLQTHKLINIR